MSDNAITRLGGPGGEVPHPLLLECDLRGQVLWMSERTRVVLGEVENLVETIECAGTDGAPAASAMRFWCVMRTDEGVLLSAAREMTAETGARAGLIDFPSVLLRHYFRLQDAERRLATLARRLRRGSGAGAIRQIELERQRLGRELHTGVGQMLAAIRMQLEVVSSQLREPPAPVGDALNRIATLASDALQQIRSVSRRIHPPEWQRLSLTTALQQLWDLSGIPEKFQAVLRIAALSEEPALETKTVIYRAAQEALSNLAQHSKAIRVEMELSVRGQELVLTIEDNGVGFDVARLLATPPSVQSGIGLRSIREQAQALGGRLELASGATGTKLELSAPMYPAET